MRESADWEPPQPQYGKPTYRLAESLPARVEDYDYDPPRDVISTVDRGQANLICSDLAGSGGMLHMPILDIDLPAALVSSSTPGNSHLYIGKALSWRKYKKLLKALEKADIIQPGFYRAAKRRGYTSVRTPWTRKGD